MIIKRDYYLNQLIASQHNGLIKIITRLSKRMVAQLNINFAPQAFEKTLPIIIALLRPCVNFR